MTSTAREAPHVYTLAQHVELREAGWWEEAIDRTIQYTLYREKGGLSSADLLRRSSQLLGLTVNDRDVLLPRMEHLVASDRVIARDDRFVLSMDALHEYEETERASKALEDSVANDYREVAERHRPALGEVPDWQTFCNDLVFPLVNELGARTLNLLRGDTTLPETRAHAQFLANYVEGKRGLAQAMVSEFLDPNAQAVREFILGYLTHYMLISSTALDKASLDRLHVETGRQEFHIVLDTNVIFSMLNLHYNPSNEAAQAFLALTRSIGRYADVHLYVLPDTLKEAQESLAGALERAPKGNVTSAMASAVGHLGEVSGLLGKYFEARAKQHSLSPALYFQPYIDGLQMQLEEIGVEVVNADTDAIRARGSFAQRVDAWYSFEYDKERGRSRSRIEHDVVALEYVADQRGGTVAAQLTEAKWWLLTVDFGLQNEERRGLQGRRAVPRSINPAELVHVLRFWVPRSEELEAALLGGIRLPFSFFQYDNRVEKTSLKILDRLSRYSNVEDFSSEFVQKIFTDQSLRTAFEKSGSSEQSEVEALESSLARAAHAAEEQVRAAEARITELEASIARLESADTKQRDIAAGKERSKAKLLSENERLKRDRDKAEERARRSHKTMSEQIATLNDELGSLRALSTQMQERREATSLRIRQGALWLFLGLCLVGLVWGGTQLSDELKLKLWVRLSVVVAATGVFLVLGWLGVHLLRLQQTVMAKFFTLSLKTWWNFVGAAVVALVLTFALDPPK